MSIRPSAATAELLSKWGIIHKVINSKLVLLCETLKDQQKVPAFLPSEAFKMVFLVSSSDPYFLNFTELPLAVKGQALYFSNHYDNVQNGELLLHRRSTATAIDQIMLRPLSFSGKLDDAARENNVTVKDDTGNTVWNKTIPAGIAEYYVSLPNEGLYTLEAGDEDAMQLYALANEHGHVLGVIELFSDDKVPAAFRLISSDNSITRQEYALQFANRATTWAYFIRSNAAGGDMWIGSAKSDVVFSGPEQVILLNGDKADAYYSESTLPLEERPKAFFQLRKGSRDGSVLVDALPAPGVSMIYPRNGSIYSEIHINL